MKGNVKEIRIEISNNPGAVNAKNSFGQSPLYYAISNGGLETVELLVEFGSEVNTKDNHDRTPLHIACYYGNIEIAKHLLNNGAHIEVVDNMGLSTPLLNAIKEGHTQLAEILIREYKANCNARDDWGRTALHYAANEGFTKIAKLALILGANIHDTNKYGWTALHYACLKGHPTMVSVYLFVKFIKELNIY